MNMSTSCVPLTMFLRKSMFRSLWLSLREYVLVRGFSETPYCRCLLQHSRTTNLYQTRAFPTNMCNVVDEASEHYAATELSDSEQEDEDLRLSSSVRFVISTGTDGTSYMSEYLRSDIKQVQRRCRYNVVPVDTLSRLIEHKVRAHPVCGGGVWLYLDSIYALKRAVTIVVCAWSWRTWRTAVIRGPMTKSMFILLSDIYEYNQLWSEEDDDLLPRYPRIISYTMPRLMAYAFLHLRTLKQRQCQRYPSWLQEKWNSMKTYKLGVWLGYLFYFRDDYAFWLCKYIGEDFLNFVFHPFSTHFPLLYASKIRLWTWPAVTLAALVAQDERKLQLLLRELNLAEEQVAACTAQLGTCLADVGTFGKLFSM